mgnify:CR=1 FL=1
MPYLFELNCRSVVLDTVLQIAESLSLADDVAGQLADNITLFNLSCHVIRLSAKDEVGFDAKLFGHVIHITHV